MNDDNLITITVGDEELVGEILFTHYHEGFNKTYVVFHLIEKDEVSAAVYVETSDTEGYFEDIETDEEWDMLDEVLASFYDELEEDEIEEDDME